MASRAVPRTWAGPVSAAHEKAPVADVARGLEIGEGQPMPMPDMKSKLGVVPEIV